MSHPSDDPPSSPTEAVGDLAEIARRAKRVREQVAEDFRRSGLADGIRRAQAAVREEAKQFPKNASLGIPADLLRPYIPPQLVPTPKGPPVVARAAETPRPSLPRFDGPTEALTWKKAATELGFGTNPGAGDALRDRVRRAADDDPLVLLRRYRVRHRRKSSCRADVVAFLKASMEHVKKDATDRATAIRADKAARYADAAPAAAARMSKLLGRLA